MGKLPPKKAVAARLQQDGYRVFPIDLSGVDLFAVKDGKASLVSVADGQEPSPVLSMLRDAGLDVRVEGLPANPRHYGYRVTKSISVKPEFQPCLAKLQQILRAQQPPKDLSEWFCEQMYAYVSGWLNV